MEIAIPWWTRVLPNLIYDELYPSGGFEYSISQKIDQTTHTGPQCFKPEQWAHFFALCSFSDLCRSLILSDYERVSCHHLIDEESCLIYWNRVATVRLIALSSDSELECLHYQVPAAMITCVENEFFYLGDLTSFLVQCNRFVSCSRSSDGIQRDRSICSWYDQCRPANRKDHQMRGWCCSRPLVKAGEISGRSSRGPRYDRAHHNDRISVSCRLYMTHQLNNSLLEHRRITTLRPQRAASA